MWEKKKKFVKETIYYYTLIRDNKDTILKTKTTRTMIIMTISIIIEMIFANDNDDQKNIF